MTEHTAVVVFDLGGVLIDLGGAPGMSTLFDSALTFEEMRERWRNSQAVYDHESGRIDAPTFAQRFIAEQAMAMSPDDFLQRFLAWPQGLHAGAAELVTEVAARYRVCALSNTSALHWRRLATEFELGTLFTERYLSFEMCAMKPDAEIYARVVAALGVPAAQIVFLDDSANNVAAAQAQGINARLAKDTQQARAVLVEIGLL